MALAGLIAGVLIGGGAFASAASTATSISDYSQCANGTAQSTACNSGWINGILNSSNSSYREDQVTPQRLLLEFPKGQSTGTHNVDITYLDRKGGSTSGIHAYDSLATWNTTETTADRCGSSLLNCPAATPVASATIPADSTVVTPFSGTGVSGNTSTHSLPDAQRVMYFYGPVDQSTIAFGTYSHSCASGSGCTSSDDYATLRVSFSLTSDQYTAGGKLANNVFVQVLFGGHLAASGTPPTSPRGWGTGLGASNINGGPYHIRITNVDLSSIGNRDNQIMSSAVLPLTVSNLTTSPGGTATTVPATWTGTAHDSASVTGTAPTGTVTFKLYGPFSSAPGSTSCIDSGTGANLLWTSSAIDITTGTSSNSGNTWTVDSGTAAPTGGIGSSSTNGAGTYQWVVSYSGDGTNIGSSSSCGDTSEQETFADAATTNATANPTP